MSRQDPNPNFINGVPELLILRLLAGREMYGYELVQAIRDQTSEIISFGEGVIYPVLHALEQAGALTSRRLTVGGRNRVYYTLTPTGSDRLTSLSANWTRLTGAIQTILRGARDAEVV